MSKTAIEFHKVGNFTSAFVKTVTVTEVGGGPSDFVALVYQCKMNVDWDGAPFAYGRDNPRDAKPPGLVWDSKTQTYQRNGRVDHFQRDLKPIEYRGLAGSLRDATDNKKDHGLFIDHDFKWVGVVSATPGDAKTNGLWIDDRPELRDRFGRFPVIQQSGPSKGYYVSQSGSAANAGSQFLQSTFWDASEVPYCVWPSMLRSDVRLGDFGLVIGNDTGRSGGFFFADTGSTTKLGECSGNLVTQVAGSPLNNDHLVTFLVFPKSGSGAAKQGQETTIVTKVRAQVSKLSGVPNAEELITFLSLGANPDTFGKTGYKGISSAGYFPVPGTPAATYENIRRGLKEWGFHSARRPIDINASPLV